MSDELEHPLVENVHYRLVPSEESDKAWNIEIISGEFVETVLSFDTVGINKIKDCATFNFNVVNSPESEYINESNVDLQEYAGRILISLIERSIEDKTLITND